MGTAEQGRPDVWLDSVGSVRIETGGQARTAGRSQHPSQSFKSTGLPPERGSGILMNHGFEQAGDLRIVTSLRTKPGLQVMQ